MNWYTVQLFSSSPSLMLLRLASTSGSSCKEIRLDQCWRTDVREIHLQLVKCNILSTTLDYYECDGNHMHVVNVPDELDGEVHLDLQLRSFEVYKDGTFGDQNIDPQFNTGSQASTESCYLNETPQRHSNVWGGPDALVANTDRIFNGVNNQNVIYNNAHTTSKILRKLMLNVYSWDDAKNPLASLKSGRKDSMRILLVV